MPRSVVAVTSAKGECDLRPLGLVDAGDRRVARGPGDGPAGKRGAILGLQGYAELRILAQRQVMLLGSISTVATAGGPGGAFRSSPPQLPAAQAAQPGTTRRSPRDSKSGTKARTSAWARYDMQLSCFFRASGVKGGVGCPCDSYLIRSSTSPNCRISSPYLAQSSSRWA
jgi:hypothetical protein